MPLLMQALVAAAALLASAAAPLLAAAAPPPPAAARAHLPLPNWAYGLQPAQDRPYAADMVSE